MRYRKPTRRSRGVSAIEFAFVLPVLLAIVLGIINYGVLLYNQAVITNAAREGARWASIHSVSGTTSASCTTSCTSYVASTTPSDPCQVACNYVYNSNSPNASYLITFGSASTLNVTPSNTTNSWGAADPQTIMISYTYSGISFPFLPSTTGVYSSTAVMLHE